jgi:hypothetical protein
VPSGAIIYLDGVDTGKLTPDTLVNVAAGAHTIKLTQSFYADTTLTVQVTANQISKVFATLRSLLAGNWNGSTSQGLSVSFTVTDSGTVENLVVRLRLDFPTFTCTGPFTSSSSIQIKNGNFSANLSNPATNIYTTLRGSFVSNNTVSGSYDGYSGGFSIICGSTFSFGTGSPLRAGTWQASKGTSSSALTHADDCDGNCPDPFSAEPEIHFQLPQASHVGVKIFSTLGEEIRTVVDGQYEAGYHRVRWDGKDKNGNPMASGMYLYQLRAGNFSQVRKMSLLR